jgi:hypothetical protein
VNDYMDEAHAALKARRRVTVRNHHQGEAGMWAGVVDGLHGDRAAAQAREFLVEVYGAGGELAHRFAADPDAARRLVAAGAIEL